MHQLAALAAGGSFLVSGMRMRHACTLALAAGCLLAGATASGQPASGTSAAHEAAAFAQADGKSLWVRVQGGQRLSESWLAAMAEARPVAPAVAAGTAEPAAEPPRAAAAYPLGLMWIAPAARPQQRQQLRRLLQDLSALAARDAQAQDWIGPLRQELASMPVTGRVALPAQDPHWLQANPSLDPILADGDEWWLPLQPQVVRVWISSGERCDLPHAPGALASSYVAACSARHADERPLADTAHVVQPDARVQSVGIAAWNVHLQAPPAPGAWVWVARRDSQAPHALHAAVADWLATQGPAGTASVPSAEPAGAPAEAPLPAAAARPRDLPRLASDWGVTGLLQTPTARTRDAGAFGLTVSRAWPYTQINLLMSPMERVEIAVRYTNTSNLLYGPAIAGNQSHKDKSAELKLRLLDEGRWTPAVAVGLRDPGGTGMFAGEYLVANKRVGEFDVSLGLGWGYLGARGDLANPLSPLGERFRTRQRGNVGLGGTAHLGTLFTGPTALFGGVQWHTPWDGVVVKLEWDGNDYQHEPSGQALATASALNAGVAWRWGGAELGLSWQRGNRWSLNLAWLGSLPALGMPKSSLPRMPAIDEPMPRAAAAATAPARPTADAPQASPAGPAGGPSASATAIPAVDPPATSPTIPSGSPRAVAPEAPVAVTRQGSTEEAPRAPAPAPDAATHALLVELAQHTGWHATGLEREETRWTAHFDHAGGAYVRERIERVLAVLHRDAPPQVTQLVLELSSRQLPMVRHEVDRDAWAAARSRFQARHQQPAQGPADGLAPPAEPRTRAAHAPSPADTPRLASGVNLSFQQHLGGPDGYLYALSARAFGQVRAWSGAWLQGALNLRLIDNYDQFRYTAPSDLPRVRTHLREFVTTRRVTLPNLQFTQAARLAEGLYGMAYAGWLEPMFAGVGAELLWRPLNSRWALGLDLNLVRKRDFEQDLGLQDYQVGTGHLTVRWDTGWHDWVAGLSAGQYLAGDRGVTLDLARVFPNGTRMGMWATKTNVSAAQFGEGSFDKGLYVSVPFDAMFTSWSGSAMTVAWQPLIRDGGAKLQRGASLWGLTDVRDRRIMEFRSAPVEAPLE